MSWFRAHMAESLDQTFGGDSAAKVAGGDQSADKSRAVAINKTKLKVSPPNSLLQRFKMQTRLSRWSERTEEQRLGSLW